MNPWSQPSIDWQSQNDVWSKNAWIGISQIYKTTLIPTTVLTNFNLNKLSQAKSKYIIYSL